MIDVGPTLRARALTTRLGGVVIDIHRAAGVGPRLGVRGNAHRQRSGPLSRMERERVTRMRAITDPGGAASDSEHPVLSVVLVVLAALCNATASVLQRKVDRDEPVDGPTGLSLLWDLAHRPAWIAGIAALIVGFLLQAAALATGPIVLVQPLLVLELPFTLLLAGAVFGSRLHAREWTAIAGMSLGLAALLYALAPSGGDPLSPSVGTWVVGLAVTLGVAGIFVVVGHRSSGSRRAAAFGLATGIGFGLTAVLVAAIGAVWKSSGWPGLLTSPFTWLLVVLGPVFFYLLQRTLQAGPLVASQPFLTLFNPVVAVGFGVAVFGERVNGSGWLVLAVAGAVLIGAGTVLLARSPLLTRTEGGDSADVSTDGRHTDRA
ncbi:MAG: hypothetical protein QOF00_5708 [Pseudonocardiales bacterium]|nr:hypothetical protein [Pseudonocardiales bacterium]